MLTGEIVDLANERRLSAELTFVRAGADLLVLNGGSRAEEVSVVTAISGRSPETRRDVYCIDSGTSLQLRLPLHPGTASHDCMVRIVGGHGEMVLAQPRSVQSPIIRHTTRSVVGMCAAALLVLSAGAHIDSTTTAPSFVAVADPEPPDVVASLVPARARLHVPARLPLLLAEATRVRDPKLSEAAPKFADRRVVLPLVSVPATKHAVIALNPVVPLPLPHAIPRLVREAPRPAPKMTDLRVPKIARSGDFVPVRFGAVGHGQVKIVASIGPTIVSKTIIASKSGTITIRSPKSDLDSRIMTVRAYAEDGRQTSIMQAMVVLVHP